jgi:D-glycero-D-manno-heptose 1,7-bisphosphate phosphatase
VSALASRKAVFLDRDGVLNELVPDRVSGMPESPLVAQDVRLVSGAAAGALALAEAGFALVCVSNQPAAAKGILSIEQLTAVHERVLALLELEGVRLDGSSLCLHHPHGVVPELSLACDCRKPAPGMLVRAAAELGLDLGESWIVGDTDADMRAGRAAGCRTLLIECSGSAHKRTSSTSPDLRAPDLAGGAERLLRQPSPTGST